MTDWEREAGERSSSSLSERTPHIPMTQLSRDAWSAGAAARAAQERVLSCRRRIEALRAEVPFDPSHARLARESLQRARERAAGADLRRRERAAIAAAQLVARSPGAIEVRARPDNLGVRLAEHGLSLRALF